MHSRHSPPPVTDRPHPPLRGWGHILSPDPSPEPTPRSRAIDRSDPIRRGRRARTTVVSRDDARVRSTSSPSSSSRLSPLFRLSSRLSRRPRGSSCTPTHPALSRRYARISRDDGWMRRRARARDGLDAIRSRSSRRERDHRSRERSSIVGDRARSSVTARGSRSIRSRSGRSRDPRRARVNHINQRETPYLGDDGGARGDAFLRARGSRRERDQSGVQRQGDHDCVCVTSRVESFIHFMFVRAGSRTRVVETDRPTRYGSGLST